MKHLQANPQALQNFARQYDPDALAKASRNAATIEGAGFAALASICARGHWLLINGQWFRR